MPLNDKEIWKPLNHLTHLASKKYAVSSHGRLASYTKSINERYILKLHKNGGFPMATIHCGGKSKALFVHNAIGATFLKKTSQKHTSVIHLDYDKANNSISNLKWVTKAAQIEHAKKSPYVLQAIARKVYTGATARKLNEKKVIQLKKDLWNPNRKLTMKQLATKYGIAEMNLYRIKAGKMWFHIHVEGEPIFPRYKEQLKNIEFHNKIAAKEEKAKTKKASIKLVKAKAPIKKIIAKKSTKVLEKSSSKKIITKKKK